MSLWNFKCYKSPAERDPIGDWYRDIPVGARAKFDVCLEYFRDNPQNLWGSERFKPLTNYDGIFEVRFAFKNILYRPLGYFGPDRHDFTFLIAAREQGDRFVPRNAPDLAIERKKQIERSEATANECCF